MSSGQVASKPPRWPSTILAGSVLGNKIELMVTDHQNKPDIGSQKFREWADRDGLTMVLGGSNTGVSIAMSSIAKEKRTPFFAIGAAGASLTGKDCTPEYGPLCLRYDRARKGDCNDHGQAGRKNLVLPHCADYAFGTQLQDAAAKVVEANGGKVVGAVRVPLSTSHSQTLLQAQSSGAQVLGLANAGNDFTNS